MELSRCLLLAALSFFCLVAINSSGAEVGYGDTAVGNDQDVLFSYALLPGIENGLKRPGAAVGLYRTASRRPRPFLHTHGVTADIGFDHHTIWISGSQHMAPRLTPTQASGAMRELSLAPNDSQWVLILAALAMLAGGLLAVFRKNYRDEL
jgi:hypothetical protein